MSRRGKGDGSCRPPASLNAASGFSSLGRGPVALKWKSIDINVFCPGSCFSYFFTPFVGWPFYFWIKVLSGKHRLLLIFVCRRPKPQLKSQITKKGIPTAWFASYFGCHNLFKFSLWKNFIKTNVGQSNAPIDQFVKRSYV